MQKLNGNTATELTSPTWTDFTPTVTLVGGVGNTVPQYTTNNGRYIQIGKIVFIEIYLTGDGGNEGAGTGQVNIALPITAGANCQASLIPCGRGTNAANFLLCADISASASTVALAYFSSITAVTGLTGADQNNASRSIRIRTSYEVD